MRIAIVAHIRFYREGLTAALTRRGIEVVGTAGDQRAAIEYVSHRLPDVALVDMTMPAAMLTMRALADNAPSVRVVALGLPETEGEVLACAEAGAAAYVTRDASVDDLIGGLGRAVEGELLCSPQITAGLLRRIGELAPRPATSAGRLTAREREIVELIRDGLSNREIALQLCVELSTVKNHVHNILEKLGVRRRGQAAALVAGER